MQAPSANLPYKVTLLPNGMYKLHDQKGGSKKKTPAAPQDGSTGKWNFPKTKPKFKKVEKKRKGSKGKTKNKGGLFSGLF